MPDVVFRSTYDDSAFIAGLDRSIKKADQLSGEFDDVNKAIDAAFAGNVKDVQSFEKAIDKSAKAVEKNKNEFEGAAKRADTFKSSLKGAANEVRILGVNVGGVISKFQGWVTSLKGVQAGLGGTVTGLKALKVALISTGIGALVVALGSVVAFLTRTQRGLDLVSRAMSGLGAVVSVIVDRISALGETIINTFQGRGLTGVLKDFGNSILTNVTNRLKAVIDSVKVTGQVIEALANRDFKALKEAAVDGFRVLNQAITGLDAKGQKEIADGIAGVVKEIKDESAAAAQLTKDAQVLRDAQQKLTVEFAKSRAEIEKRRNAFRDESLSDQERINNLEEAIKIEKRLETQRLELAQENLRIITARNKLGESFTPDLEAQAQAQAEVSNIQAEAARRQREDLSQINSLRRQGAAELKTTQEAEKKRVEELTKAYNQLFETFEQRVQQARLASLEGTELLQAERELAIQAVDELVNAVKQKADEAGQELPAAFETNIKLLYDQIEAEFREGVQDLRQSDAIDIVAPLEESLKRDLTEEGAAAAKRVVDGINKGVKDNKPALERIKEEILLALKITEEEFGIITEQVGGIFSNLQSGIASATEAQIAQQDALIEAINERVSATEEALNRELSLAEQGFANNVDIEKRRLEALQKQRDEAEKKRLELEKKAARQRLFIESAQQASSLATAAAKVFSAEANKGLLGIAFAIAAIATIFATFQKFKAEAAKSALEVPKFRTGTKMDGSKGLHIPGPSHEQGGVPILYRNRLIEGEGGQWMINTAQSQEHDKFLARMNANEFRGVDLSSLADFARNAPAVLSGNVARIEATGIRPGAGPSQRELEEIKAEVRLMRKALESRPVIIPDGGHTEMTRKGNTTRRKRISP